MKKDNTFRDCVLICREYNRQEAKIEITTIEKGVTSSLVRQLSRLSMQETHYRYFLVKRRDFQRFRASILHQIEFMNVKNNKMIVEFGRAAIEGARETA